MVLMSNAQLYLAVGVPLLGNLALYLLLRNDVRRIEDSLRAEIATLRDLLIGKVIEHGERLARLEPR